MRNVFLLIVITALWPASMAAAEQPRTQKPDKPVSAGRQLPLKGAAGNPCAVHGPGFVRVAGSETCVKIGGAVSVEVGGSR